MQTGSPYRPRVSRETRLLLTAGVMAVAALWLLARLRFPERPVTPNPVPSVLSQLATGPKYDDLAREIAQLHARLQPSLLALDAPSAVAGSPQTSPRRTAIRLRDDLAVTLIPSGPNRERCLHPRPRCRFRPGSRPCIESGHDAFCRCHGHLVNRSSHAMSSPGCLAGGRVASAGVRGLAGSRRECVVVRPAVGRAGAHRSDTLDRFCSPAARNWPVW